MPQKIDPGHSDVSDIMTPERRFFRFAFPCVEQRFQLRLISPADRLTLMNLVASGQPSRELLERCFPDAVTDYAKYLASLRLNQDGWTYETVGDFWHHHHSHSKPHSNHDVLLARFMHRLPDVHIIMAEVRNKPLPFRDPFSLEPKPGGHIYVHGETAVEIAEET